MTKFTYNQQSGESAGAGAYINETGKYVGKLLQAEYVVSTKKETKGIEFTFEASDGAKCQYLSAWYEKADGTKIKMGIDMINAIMGCTKTQALSLVIAEVNNEPIDIAPELTNKPIGLVLQKTLKTKQDGSDSYSFEIRIPFIAQTGKTLKEQMSGKDAQAVERMVSTLKDKDERTGGNQSGGMGQQQAVPQSEMPADFDDWG
jgi:hypothetical protein